MGSEGNFLAALGMSFHDFAGSTVVHTHRRLRRSRRRHRARAAPRPRFKRDGGGPMLPHDLTIATVGGFILWFGWYGFNPGSTLSAMDFEGIGRVAANTTLAACAAGPVGDVLRLPEDEDVGRELHGQRLPRRTRGDHLPLLLGVADGRDPARRHRRRDRRGGGRRPRVRCASTTRSAPCPCTASAASGARCRSVSSRPASSARPGRWRPTTRRP